MEKGAEKGRGEKGGRARQRRVFSMENGGKAGRGGRVGRLALGSAKRGGVCLGLLLGCGCNCAKAQEVWGARQAKRLRVSGAACTVGTSSRARGCHSRRALGFVWPFGAFPWCFGAGTVWSRGWAGARRVFFRRCWFPVGSGGGFPRGGQLLADAGPRWIDRSVG